MVFNCSYWNISGLESLDRKYILRRFLNLEKHKDFVLVQEVRSTNATLDTNLKFI